MRKAMTFIIIILMAVCFASCGPLKLAETSGDLTLPKDFWLRVDGSTATIPISEALSERFGGTEAVTHNKTSNAYQNLLDGKADLIFVLEPSADALEMFEAANIEVELFPIVKDAFVLFVNTQNPIHDLTVEELKYIYTGNITNWKNFGGEDLTIIPFQRNQDAGSQTLFILLLMQDEKPLTPPTDYIRNSMKDIIDSVAYEDRGRAGIGFNVFYYAKAMYENENIRMLKVDGVEPSLETISKGEYPLETYYYAVIRKDTPPDDPIRKLISFILTDEGQEMMKETGYVPIGGIE